MDDADAIAANEIALVDIPADKPAERADVYATLGTLYAKIGKLNEAIRSFLKALELNPSEESHWSQFADTIKFAQFSAPNAIVKEAVLKAFYKPTVNTQHLAIPALSLLKLMLHYATASAIILEDPLLHALLEHTIVPDADFEAWMTGVRRNLLLSPPEASQRFVKALAAQCEINEYLYTETPEETNLIEEWQNHTEYLTQMQRLMLSCYRLRSDSSEVLADDIPSLKPIEDFISLRVQAQYEENPYPRWKETPRQEPITIANTLHEAFPDRTFEEIRIEQPEILIAGCGTGQQAINAALKYACSRITAIDLSFKSLTYAKAKAKEMGLQTIEFIQGDILDLHSLNRQFDLIECTGVLHHMREPITGWKILTEILKPRGIMSIGLYSEIARQDVVAARRFIQQQGYQPTLEGIRECRAQLLKSAQFQTLTRSVDFYTVSSCRDLLFHVQEHRFTLEQIGKILNELGLELIGLELKDPTALEKYRELFPDDKAAISLANWHRFEQLHPQTFIGMYHLWLQKAR